MTFRSPDAANWHSRRRGTPEWSCSAHTSWRSATPRDSDRFTTKIRYQATRLWHFVDIELTEPNLASACFGHPPLPTGIRASNGPPRVCVVDKVDQFAAELASPATADSERLLALKFLLHFVGDLHQPLHAADDHDAGGTEEPDVAEGFHPGNLHHYWDIEFVERLGTDPRRVAASLIGQISDAQRQEWASGKPADWAMEAFALARSDAADSGASRPVIPE